MKIFDVLEKKNIKLIFKFILYLFIYVNKNNRISIKYSKIEKGLKLSRFQSCNILNR